MFRQTFNPCVQKLWYSLLTRGAVGRGLGREGKVKNRLKSRGTYGECFKSVLSENCPPVMPTPRLLEAAISNMPLCYWICGRRDRRGWCRQIVCFFLLTQWIFKTLSPTSSVRQQDRERTLICASLCLKEETLWFHMWLFRHQVNLITISDQQIIYFLTGNISPSCLKWTIRAFQVPQRAIWKQLFLRFLMAPRNLTQELLADSLCHIYMEVHMRL